MHDRYEKSTINPHAVMGPGFMASTFHPLSKYPVGNALVFIGGITHGSQNKTLHSRRLFVVLILISTSLLGIVAQFAPPGISYATQPLPQ